MVLSPFKTKQNLCINVYKCTNFYHPEYESGIFCNDPSIGINWPSNEYGIHREEILLSEKD